jgi:hypothetical protein
MSPLSDLLPLTPWVVLGVSAGMLVGAVALD